MSVKQYVAPFTGYPAGTIRRSGSFLLTSENNRKLWKLKKRPFIYVDAFKISVTDVRSLSGFS